MAYDLVSSMQKLAERYVKVSSLSLVIVLVIVAAIAMRAIYVMGWVNHTNQTIAQINLFINALVDAEAAERGYLATGKESFLEQYKAALRDRPAMMSKLAALVKDRPQQAERASALIARAEAVVTCSDSVVDLVQKNIWPKRGRYLPPGLVPGGWQRPESWLNRCWLKRMVVLRSEQKLLKLSVVQFLLSLFFLVLPSGDITVAWQAR